MGNHQRDHLAQRQALLRQRGILVARRIQQPVYLVHIGAKPYPETIPQAVHLPIAGSRRERYRVEIGPGDQLARLQRLGAQPVGPHTGGGHLADLLGG